MLVIIDFIIETFRNNVGITNGFSFRHNRQGMIGDQSDLSLVAGY